MRGEPSVGDAPAPRAISAPHFVPLTIDRGWTTSAFRLALVAGVLVRLAIFLALPHPTANIVDEQHYLQLAGSLARGDGFAWDAGVPTSIRPPLYPAFVATVNRWISVDVLRLVFLLQCLMSAGTAALIYRLGRRTHGEQAARLATAALWLYPSLVFFNFTLLTETLFTLLLVAFLLLLLVLLIAPRATPALGCGAALGLAALTRSIMWPVPLLVVPMLLVTLRTPWRRRLVMVTIFLVGYSAVVGPWAARNTQLQGVPTVVDTMSGLNMWMGNYERTPEDRMWAAVDQGGTEDLALALQQAFPNGTLTEGQKDKWAQREAIRYMLDHPAQTVRRSMIRFADFWGLEREFIAGVQQGLYSPPTWFFVAATVAITLSYVLVATLGVAGMWLARPDLRAHVVLLLPVVVITGVHTLVFGHSRYHIPLIPILAIYASALVVRRHEMDWSLRRPAVWGAAASVAILLAIWARQVLLTDAARLGALLGHG